MPDVRVACINKSNRNSAFEGITHLGNTAAGWKWSRQQVIDSIEAGTNTFYTLVGGNRSEIGVVNGENSKYLRTYADNTYNDNLLALPECP